MVDEHLACHAAPDHPAEEVQFGAAPADRGCRSTSRGTFHVSPGSVPGAKATITRTTGHRATATTSSTVAHAGWSEWGRRLGRPSTGDGECDLPSKGHQRRPGDALIVRDLPGEQLPPVKDIEHAVDVTAGQAAVSARYAGCRDTPGARRSSRLTGGVCSATADPPDMRLIREEEVPGERGPGSYGERTASSRKATSSVRRSTRH